MIEAVVRRGTLVTVCLLILCVIGSVAAWQTPVQMIPDLDLRTISVRTFWPGAAPQDVESEILVEQEEFLRRVPNLSRLVSTAATGEARIEMEFPYDTDVTAALINVNNALNQVPSYPETVRRPRVYATSFSGNSFMFFRVTPMAGISRDIDMDMIYDFVDRNVVPRMESVPGVSSISIWGGAERQIQVRVDPRALTERNLSLTDIRDAMRARNRDMTGGEIDQGKRRYMLRTIGRFGDVTALKSLVLRRDGDTIVRLGDVAQIDIDHAELSWRNSVNGEPVLLMSARREAGSNVLQIKAELLRRLPVLNRDVLNPAGMELELTADDVGYVQASLDNVWRNLAIGAVLATLVMFVFLRSVAVTLIGVMGIPICAIAAVFGLYLMGRTINVISLAGVAFALGMTLDNTIVVLENIDTRRRQGMDRIAAAVAGLRDVWPAVLASTATTVLVFLPVVFIKQEAGQLYSDVAIAICAAIIVSMLVALTVVPAASAHLKHLGVPTVAGRREISGSVVQRMVSWLTRGVIRPLACTVGVLAISGIIFMFLTPPASYLPEGEEPKTFAVMRAPPGYNLATMTRIGDEIESYFLPYVQGIDPKLLEGRQVPEKADVGAPPVPPIRYMILRVTTGNLRIIAETVDPARLGELMDALTHKFRAYPGMRAFAARGSIITSNDGGTRSINVDVSGASLPAVFAAAESIFRRAREVFDNPRVNSSPSTRALSQPMIEVRPDWNRAAELGLDLQDIGFSVAAVTNGAYLDEFYRGDDKIDIYLYGQQQDKPQHIDDIANMQLYSPGGVVTLSSVAQISETIGTADIRRVNGQRTVTVNIIPPDDIPLESGVQAVRDELIAHLRRSGEIPPEINTAITGASDQLNETRAALASNYLIAVAIVYLLLVAILVHWGFPLLIMMTIPLGMAGGIIGLNLLNWVGNLLPAVGLARVSQPFDMISMLGFLILMGTVVNNPILVVIRIMENTRQKTMSIVDAVVEATVSRVRPIAMTTITTLCGLAPLVLWGGEGTELYRGVGAIVMFGLLGSAIVSLTFLPALSVIVLRLIRRETR